MGVGWLNTVLIGLVGVLAMRRWPRLVVFPAYALFVCALMFIGKLPGFYEPMFYMFREWICIVCCLAAIMEALRRATGRWPWWVLAAFVLPALAPFMGVDLALRYQLQREALVVTQALLIFWAARSPQLRGWVAYGLMVMASDVVKLLNPAAAMMLLRAFDPLMFTAMCGVWLWALLEPERVMLVDMLRPGRGRARIAWAMMEDVQTKGEGND